MNEKIEELNRKLMASVCPGSDRTMLTESCDKLNLPPVNATSLPINSTASPTGSPTGSVSEDILPALSSNASREQYDPTQPMRSPDATGGDPSVTSHQHKETRYVSKEPKACPADLGAATACYDRQPAFSCYCLMFTHRNWWDSSARRHSRSMQLVSIETLEEQQLLQLLIVTVRAQYSSDFIPGLDFGWWTSGSDAANEGVWIWSASGQPVSDLGRGVPDDGSSYNNGLLLYSDGFYWVDAVMSESAYSICEY